MATQSFCPKVVISLSFCPEAVIGLPFSPKVVIGLSFRRGPRWVASSWLVFSKVLLGQLIWGGVLLVTLPLFFGESWEGGHHVGVPDSHPPY